MKTNSKTFKSLLISVLFSAMIFSSCQEDAEKPSNVDEKEQRKSVEKVLALREDLDFINRFVDEKAFDISSKGGRRSVTKTIIERLKESAPCAEPIEEEISEGVTQVTLDFGGGCQTEDVIEVSGKVVMTFGFSENTLTYSLEFIDYSEDSGENAGEVANGTAGGTFIIDLEFGQLFIQEMEQDLTITYPDGTEASYKVAQRAEMTEDGLRVASMTASGNFAEGGAFIVTVTKALVFDFSCESDLPIEGEEVVTFQGNTIKVNYGNGTCDDKYTVN